VGVSWARGLLLPDDVDPECKFGEWIYIFEFLQEYLSNVSARQRAVLAARGTKTNSGV
jgi:hypothetical protein